MTNSIPLITTISLPATPIQQPPTMSQQHPTHLPDLPPTHIPTSLTHIPHFLTSPESPFVHATQPTSGFPYRDVVGRWLVPVLDRVCGEPREVAGFLGSDWVREGEARGKGVVLLWVL
jgi:hypothetical protein